MSICSIHESKLGFEEWKTTFARSRFACLLDWGCWIVTGHVPKYEFSGRRNKLKHGLSKLVELDFPSFFVILFDTFSKFDHFYFSYSYPPQFEISQKIGKYLNEKKNNSTWLYAHFWVYITFLIHHYFWMFPQHSNFGMLMMKGKGKCDLK